MDLIQQDAFGCAFGQGLFQKAFFAGTFDKISDFEIVFIFKNFFCHFLGLPAEVK